MTNCKVEENENSNNGDPNSSKIMENICMDISP